MRRGDTFAVVPQVDQPLDRVSSVRFDLVLVPDTCEGLPVASECLHHVRWGFRDFESGAAASQRAN